MAQMTVQVVTPDGLKYDHHASFIHAVTKDGQIGICLLYTSGFIQAYVFIILSSNYIGDKVNEE